MTADPPTSHAHARAREPRRGLGAGRRRGRSPRWCRARRALHERPPAKRLAVDPGATQGERPAVVRVGPEAAERPLPPEPRANARTVDLHVGIEEVKPVSESWPRGPDPPNDSRKRACACSDTPSPSPHAAIPMSCSNGRVVSAQPTAQEGAERTPRCSCTRCPSTVRRTSPVPAVADASTESRRSGRRSIDCTQVAPVIRRSCAPAGAPGRAPEARHGHAPCRHAAPARVPQPVR